jgi:hypothetical protein
MMKGFPVRVFVVLLPAFFFAACSSSGIKDVTISAGENVTIVDSREGAEVRTIEASTEEQHFLLLPFSASNQPGDTEYTYNLQLDIAQPASVSPADDPSQATLKALTSASATSPFALRIAAETAIRREDEQLLSEADETIRANRSTFDRFLRERVLTRVVVSPPPQTLHLFSPFQEEINLPINGILRGSSGTAAIYVDSRVNSQVAEIDVQQLLSGFQTITHPRLRTLFGDESDIDHNGAIVIFLAEPQKVGSNVIGFFRPVDLLPDGTSSSIRSNEAEIVFVRTPGKGFDLATAQATIAHEVFHLINFAQKSLPSFAQTGHLSIHEELFLNEGLAHLAEDLTGYGICTPSLVQTYLQCINETSLAGGGNAGATGGCSIVADGSDSLARRGGTALFLLYMFQQLGGATYSEVKPGELQGNGVEFLRKLNTSTSTGITNLERASGRSFFGWYADFAAALALDNSGLSNDPRYAFSPEAEDPFTGLTRNIRVRSVRSDSNGTYMLTGPKILRETTATSNVAIDGSLFSTGANALRITVPAGVQPELSFDGARSLSPGLTIVRVP